MDLEAFERVADLVRERNAIDAQIGTIIERPVAAGHLGEWVAAQIFDIELEASAVAKAIDGRFASGPLEGRTVNIKWYGKRDGLLDMVDDPTVEFYLVMTGVRSNADSSRGKTRPLTVDAAFLFEAGPLLENLRSRGVKIGIATSVVGSVWDAAEIFPDARNPALPLTRVQIEALQFFSTTALVGLNRLP